MGLSCRSKNTHTASGSSAGSICSREVLPQRRGPKQGNRTALVRIAQEGLNLAHNGCTPTEDLLPLFGAEWIPSAKRIGNLVGSGPLCAVVEFISHGLPCLDDLSERPGQGRPLCNEPIV